MVAGPWWFLIFVLFVLVFVWKTVLGYLNYQYLKRHRNEIPESLREVFSEEDVARAESYALDHMRYASWKRVYDFVIMGWWVFGGGFLALFQLVMGWHLSLVWTGVVIVWLATVIFVILDMPWEAYQTFVLEARYGFTTMTVGLWVRDTLVELLLFSLLELPLLWVALSLVEKLPQGWWIVVWVVYVGFSLFVMYIAPYVIDPLFNKYEPLEEEYGEPIRQWAEKQGVNVRAVVKMDASRRTRHSNAYFTGIGRTKRIVVFDTLFQNFSMEEILSILSHELGHWRNHHIVKQMVMQAFLSLVGLWGVFVLSQHRLLSQVFGVSREVAFSSYGFLVEIFFLGFVISTLGVWVQPVGAYFSRRMEREADAYAVRVMGGSASLRSALLKLYKENLAPFHVHPFVARMTYSHPPLLERLSFLAHEEEMYRR